MKGVRERADLVPRVRGAVGIAPPAADPQGMGGQTAERRRQPAGGDDPAGRDEGQPEESKGQPPLCQGGYGLRVVALGQADDDAPRGLPHHERHRPSQEALAVVLQREGRLALRAGAPHHPSDQRRAEATRAGLDPVAEANHELAAARRREHPAARGHTQAVEELRQGVERKVVPRPAPVAPRLEVRYGGPGRPGRRPGRGRPRAHDDQKCVWGASVPPRGLDQLDKHSASTSDNACSASTRGNPRHT